MDLSAFYRLGAPALNHKLSTLTTRNPARTERTQALPKRVGVQLLQIRVEDLSFGQDLQISVEGFKFADSGWREPK